MSFFDTPRGWWVYRWAHHFWVLSFNRNPNLYRVVWWSKYTRPIFYNTKGRLRLNGYGPAAFMGLFLFLSVVWAFITP